ncbi:MAG: HEAT repeat domain-containing protein [Nitrospinae bacterium]|nr:HEAT repeat domain-containing protein [Nitrospinota bacterium]
MDQNLFETLLKATGDQNANVRKAAAQALGDIDNSHGKAALAKLLKDKVWQVREEAVNSLGKLKVAEVSDRLLKMIGLDKEEGAIKAILQWAASRGEEQAKDAKGPLPGAAAPKAPEGEPWQVKRAAALALAHVRPDLVVAPLLGMLGAGNPTARQAAMAGLATVQAEEAVEQLLPYLADDDWNMRKVTATILGKLKSREATPGLLKLLDDDKFAVRIEAVIALNHIKPPEAVEALTRIVAHDTNYDVRRTAATALGNQRDGAAAQALFPALADDHWMVRKAAVDALVNLKATEAAEAILPLLGDEQEDVRAAAASALITLNRLSRTRGE